MPATQLPAACLLPFHPLLLRRPSPPLLQALPTHTSPPLSPLQLSRRLVRPSPRHRPLAFHPCCAAAPTVVPLPVAHKQRPTWRTPFPACIARGRQLRLSFCILRLCLSLSSLSAQSPPPNNDQGREGDISLWARGEGRLPPTPPGLALTPWEGPAPVVYGVRGSLSYPPFLWLCWYPRCTLGRVGMRVWWQLMNRATQYGCLAILFYCLGK